MVTSTDEKRKAANNIYSRFLGNSLLWAVELLNEVCWVIVIPNYQNQSIPVTYGDF